MTELLVALTWASIMAPTYINPVFREVLPSEATLSAMLVAAGLIFCPGLFEAFQSETPPSSDWFQSLPSTIPLNVWGVYVLVLRRNGFKPLVYVGSGTSSIRGVRARTQNYEYGVLVPQYVQTALKDGYTIVHKALLVSAPLPAPGNIPALRTAFVAMEAAITCYFGVFRNRDKSYGFGDLRYWSQDLFEWDGLCSHSPLLEPIHGEFDLNAEQLEAMAAATREKNRQFGIEYQRKLRANPTAEYREQQRKNNKKQRVALKSIYANRVANKTFYCDACKVACRDKDSLKRHEKTPRHSKKVEMGDDDYHCEACDISFKYKSGFASHNTCKSHLARMAA